LCVACVAPSRETSTLLISCVQVQHCCDDTVWAQPHQSQAGAICSASLVPVPWTCCRPSRGFPVEVRLPGCGAHLVLRHTGVQGRQHPQRGSASGSPESGAGLSPFLSG
jgi:hypothetical protein